MVRSLVLLISFDVPLLSVFLWNIGGRGDLPEHHLGEVEVRLRLPVLARKMFHYEWKG